MFALASRLPLRARVPRYFNSRPSPLGFVAGFALFSGTAIRRSPARPWAILATAAFAALVTQTIWQRRDRIDAFVARHPRWTKAGLLFVSTTLYLVHAFVLVRLYPMAHALAAAGSLATLILALNVGTHDVPQLSRTRLALGLVFIAVLGGWLMVRSQARRALARQRAPIAGYLLPLLGRLVPAAATVRGVQQDNVHLDGRDLDFRALDIVLVTVDALRADRLGAYGSSAGLTPALDAIAAQGIVVERAYCTTPHTSYSISSLMTGKYFREVSALGPPEAPQDTLAALLGDAGYQTVAFYPPAVFNVDGERLGGAA